MTTCLTNNDCPKEKSICNQTLGLCIECNHTTDCGIGYQCINNICKEIPYCGGQDLNCVEYKPYAICDPNLDRCVECVINENCRYNQSCVNRKCQTKSDVIKPCSISGECVSGYTCVNGFCSKKEYKYLYITLVLVCILIFLFFIYKKWSHKYTST